MTTFNDSFLDLDRRREQLEDTIASIRKSLQYWQTWEAEYEGFKEEIENLGEEPERDDLQGAATGFGGILLNDKEIKTILEDGRGQQRGADQVLGLLSRRVDYVQENVKVVSNRLQIAEDKLSAIDVVIHPEVRTEDGLPLTEIMEELDDDGNVISSSTSRPGDVAPQVAEALRKAGVKDLPNLEGPKQNSSLPTGSSLPPYSPEDSQPKSELWNATTTNEESAHPRSSIDTAISTDVKELFSPVKKSVSFARDTKTATDDKIQAGNGLSAIPKKLPAQPVHGPVVDRGSFQQQPSSSLPLLDPVSGSAPEIQISESPEDAVLRRQMLHYSMTEVAAIVAEMNIEDNESLSEHSRETDDEYASNTDDDDEDQFGRTTRRVVDEDYRKQMMELERKLNAKVLENVGPNPILPNSASIVADRPTNTGESSLMHNGSEGPDIGGQAHPGISPFSTAEGLAVLKARNETLGKVHDKKAPTAATGSSKPFSDAIVERDPAKAVATTTPVTEKKQSRFKASRTAEKPKTVHLAKSTAVSGVRVNNGPLASADSITSLKPVSRAKQISTSQFLIHPSQTLTRSTPEGPVGKIHAEVLVERPPSETDQVATEPDEFDPAIMQQELAVAYRQMRNRIIHRNGGFLQEEEEPAEIPVSEDAGTETGGRRISKFKAARLARLVQ